ncbi:hypothetical protein G9A89_014453 [Geosiphon pyriformis]|nr:hypothetical protein G9A89_014453 [Geosiphon pyriformis]
MPVISDVVDSSAGPLSLVDIGGASVKPVVSWKSKVGSISSSRNTLDNCKDSLKEDFRQQVDFRLAFGKEYTTYKDN